MDKNSATRTRSRRSGFSSRITALLALLIVIEIGVIGYALIRGNNLAILNPKGVIAAEQKNLILIATGLMLVVVIPVYIMTFLIAHRYRARNKHATYTPDWDSNRKLEAVWWGVPMLIIGILAVITWQSTHSLDPYRPIASDQAPLRIKVVALQWKWLFIYPDTGIATVNEVRMPIGRPVTFEITADAPMNSFWIPQLGGQVYAMSGMQTKLHLRADEAGTFEGLSANISGEGFAGMKFKAIASDTETYESWVKLVQTDPDRLTASNYPSLASPSVLDQPSFFADSDDDLYDMIISKYTDPETMHGRRYSEEEGRE